MQLITNTVKIHSRGMINTVTGQTSWLTSASLFQNPDYLPNEFPITNHAWWCRRMVLQELHTSQPQLALLQICA